MSEKENAPERKHEDEFKKSGEIDEFNSSLTPPEEQALKLPSVGTQERIELEMLYEAQGEEVSLRDLFIAGNDGSVHSTMASLREIGAVITNRLEPIEGTRRKHSFYRLHNWQDFEPLLDQDNG